MIRFSLVVCSLVAAALGHAEEPIQWRGDWQQGSLLLGAVPPGYRVTYQNRDLKISDQGYFLLGLDRDQGTDLALKITDPEGHQTPEHLHVSQRKYDIQYVEGVPQKTVNPPAEELKRIARESVLVSKAREVVTDATDFLDGFIQPLDGPVTGVYGSQRFYNGEPRRPHFGVDYAGPVGAPVKAPAAGVVLLANDDLFFSGGTLIVDHGHGLSSTFMHLSKILVKEGDRINRGDLIARVGATGRATGPHLDWRMNWHQVRIDPQLVLKSFPAR